MHHFVSFLKPICLHCTLNRFLPRFLEIVNDVDDEVARRGVLVLGALMERGAVAVEAASGVFKLLADDSAAVRSTAAHVVSGMLAALGGGGEGDEAADGGGEQAASPAGKTRGGRRQAAAAAGGSGAAGQRQLSGLLAVLQLLQRSGDEAAPEEDSAVALRFEEVCGIVDCMFVR